MVWLGNLFMMLVSSLNTKVEQYFKTTISAQDITVNNPLGCWRNEVEFFFVSKFHYILTWKQGIYLLNKFVTLSVNANFQKLLNVSVGNNNG